MSKPPVDLHEEPVIEESESPPIPDTDEQKEIFRLRNIVRQLNTKLKKISMQKEDKIKKTSRELLDTLSTSHDGLMQSQRKKFEEIINELNQTHKLTMKSLTDYYENRVNEQQKQLDEYNPLLDENKSLKNQMSDLEQSLSVSKERLNDIQCLLLGNTPTKQKQQTLSPKRQEQFIKKENDNINETIRQHERQIIDQKNMIDSLNKDLQAKDTKLNNMMFQVNYYKDLNEKVEFEKKRLESENSELTKNLETMQDRHKDQFSCYEKLLKKCKQEVNLHKREIDRLRDHCGNFPPSPAARRLCRRSNSTPNFRTKLIRPRAVQQIQIPLSLSQESLPSDMSVMSSLPFSLETNSVETILMSPSLTSSKSGVSEITDLSKLQSFCNLQEETVSSNGTGITTNYSTSKDKNDDDNSSLIYLSLSSASTDKPSKAAGKSKTLKKRKRLLSKKKNNESLNNTSSNINEICKLKTPAKSEQLKTSKTSDKKSSKEKEKFQSTSSDVEAVIATSNKKRGRPRKTPSKK